MKQDMTMGSLFSGSGGFELAASIFGIKPLWASEIEPFPIMVTATNFPEMEHLGNISKLDGAKIPKVTVISGGSPCQDMSVAGMRAGLDGSRSNLFREQIRIVKEMRADDIRNGRTGKYIRPRFMVWENVPGAFSSNKGKDFQSVLQEIVSIVDETATVPLPPKSKWTAAGCIMGDTYSIAWRTFDAQYWGVPQRRKRIYLVADFGGNTAPKILFEREGLSRNFKESREAWQGTAEATGTGNPSANSENENPVHCYDIGDRRTIANESIGVAPTLLSKMGTGGNNVPVVIETHGQDARWNLSEDNIVQTLASNMGTGGGNVPLIIDKQRRCFVLSIDTSHADDVVRIGDKAPTLTSRDYKGGNTILAAIPVADKATRNKGGGSTRNDDGAGNGLGVGEPGAPAYTLTAADRHGVAYAIDRAAFNQGTNAQYNISIQEEVAQTLVAKGPGAVAHPSCYAMQAIGEYKESDKASTLKQRDYKDNTDLVVTPSSPCYTVDDMKMQNTYIWEEQANTLAQRDYKSPQAVAYPTEMTENLWEYIVRRLTPLECCRLQGFPDYWTQALGIAEPTEDDILYWRMIFREQAEALGETKKEKTDNQIRKWLQNPSSDSAVYKMWGNGIALPNAMFVMEGIAMILQEENEHEE